MFESCQSRRQVDSNTTKRAKQAREIASLAARRRRRQFDLFQPGRGSRIDSCCSAEMFVSFTSSHVERLRRISAAISGRKKKTTTQLPWQTMLRPISGAETVV